MKILIVEDSSTMRRIIRNTINIMGYTDILEAEDGAEAIDILEINPDINLVITDRKMPNMDGVELVKSIRESDKYASIPIVMITSEGGKMEVINALKAGVTSYIIKPLTPQVLKDKLEPIFETIEMPMLEGLDELNEYIASLKASL